MLSSSLTPPWHWRRLHHRHKGLSQMVVSAYSLKFQADHLSEKKWVKCEVNKVYSGMNNADFFNRHVFLFIFIQNHYEAVKVDFIHLLVESFMWPNVIVIHYVTLLWNSLPIFFTFLDFFYIIYYKNTRTGKKKPPSLQSLHYIILMFHLFLRAKWINRKLYCKNDFSWRFDHSIVSLSIIMHIIFFCRIKGIRRLT